MNGDIQKAQLEPRGVRAMFYALCIIGLALAAAGYEKIGVCVFTGSGLCIGALRKLNAKLKAWL